MTDTLRADCEKLAYELYAVSALHTYTDRLLAFARSQQGAGLREAAEHLQDLMDDEVRSTDDDVWDHLRWGEAQATAREKGEG
jgi:hypothetical protein